MDIKKIDLSKHWGYSGFSRGQLTNGKVGIGTSEQGDKVIVVCCSNCGDYSHVNVSDIDKVSKKKGRK